MTTAPAASSPEQRVIATVRALRASRRIGNDELARRLHISRSTWYDRMRTGQFTVGEMVALADYFGVTVQSIIDGQLTVATVGAKLRMIKGGGRTSGLNRPLMHVAHVPN